MYRKRSFFDLSGLGGDSPDADVSVAERRKAGEARDHAVPDGRDPTTDASSLARAVADHHAAYIERTNANIAWVEAEARLAAAWAERSKAITACDELLAACTDGDLAGC